MLSRLKQIYLQRSSSTKQQINSLDGLRGLAVLIVIFSHLSGEGLHIAPGLDFRGAGHYGVYLFFVLSSFLLTLPILQRPISQFLDVGLWLRYFTRRFLRIFPPYIIVLLINYACVAFLGLSYFFPLSFKEVVWPSALRIGYAVIWTIPVEFKYYFVLPVVAFLFVVLLRKRIAVVLLFTIAAVCIVSFILWPPLELKGNEVALWPYLPIFLMGSLTALLHSELAKIGGLKSTYLKILFEGISVIAFLFIVILFPHFWPLFAGKYARFFNPARDFLLIGLLWSLFIFFYLNGAGIVRKILESSLLRFTGIVSFSAYLWHVPIIRFMKANVTTHTLAAISLAITTTLIAAALSHILIERPFMKVSLHKYVRKPSLFSVPKK